MGTMMRGLLTAGLFLGGLGLTGAAAPLTLVKDGAAQCVIVIPSVPNDGAVFVANELQLHFKKVTGAEVAIQNDREKLPAGLTPIYVGDGRGPRQLGLSTKDYDKQEYSLTFLPEAIVLMGRDIVEYPVTGRQGKPLAKGRFGAAWNPGWACATVKDHGFDDAQGSMECWVYKAGPKGGEDTGMLIWGIGDGNNAHRLSTEKQADKSHALVYETKVNGQASQVVVGKEWLGRKPGWHHVLCTWDAAAGKQAVYFDGKPAGEAAYQKTACAQFPAFGIKAMSDGVPYCVGPLDEIRLSNTVRKPGVLAAPFEPDSHTLVLIHGDDPSGFPFDSSEYPRQITGKPARDGRLATMYAVYDFIEDYLGVRWYMPGDLGMVFDEQKTLTVTGKDVRRKPVMMSRLSSNNGMGYDEDKWGGKMSRLLYADATPEDIDLYGYRLRYGGPGMAANHSFYGYHDRYKKWKANPQDPALGEYAEDVALFEKGTLMAQGYPEPTQLCYSSPDTVAQVIKDARSYFDQGRSKDGASVGPGWFGIVPSDDGFWCKCERCQGQLKFPGNESGNNIPTFGNGLEANASYMVWNFTKQVAEALKKSHPDKYINQLAYIEYLGIPRDKNGKLVELPENIVLGYCFGTRPILSFDPKLNKEVANYKQWMEISKKKGWLECFWLYQCFPNQFGAMQGWLAWPGFHAHNLDKSMRMFIEDDVDGLFLCGIADFIDGWLTFKYMYNPDFDVDKELDEFFTRFYGPAAQPMKDFYLLVEKRFLDANNYPRSGYQAQEGITWSSLGTPPVMEELHGYILKARELAVEEPYRRRVDVFCVAVWDHMKEGSKQWLAKQPGGKHPWPFRVQAEFATQERGIPYFGRAYFRSGANPFGLWKHGFDDAKGTMEAAVWCGPIKTNGNNQGMGTLFEIAPLDLSSGHRVTIAGNAKNTGYVATYETWAGGKTNRITGPAMGTNQWHHLAAAWQAGSNGAMVLYIDQKAVGKKPYRKTACADAPTFDIGGGVMGQSFGAIDEIRLSKVPRSPKKPTAPWETDEDTLLLLHFDEGEGEQVRDHSGVAR